MGGVQALIPYCAPGSSSMIPLQSERERRGVNKTFAALLQHQELL